MGQRNQGNAIGAQLDFERQMVKIGIQLMRFELAADRLFDEGLVLKGMSVRFKTDEQADYLIVVRADDHHEPVVAFTSSDTLADALRKMAASLENNSMKWREDQYANE